jgi:hypothetical protein
MATNDFGFSSALASFENAYSNKASRDYTKQQTKGLADENQRKDIQNVSNTVLGQDAFGVKDGALVADVPKVMNLSDGAFENWFNAGNNARNYYDKETGETVQGYLLKPKAFKDPETGTIRYSLQIRDKNGDIKPVTASRSTDPDERPAFVDANFLATIFEGQLANTLTQGGLSGYALGKLQGLNLGDSEAGRIQLQLGEDLNKGTSEQISSAVLGVNDIFAGKRTAEDVSSAEDVSTIKGRSGKTTEDASQPTTEKVGSLPLYTVDPSTPEVKGAAQLLESASPSTIYNKEEIKTLSEGLSPGFQRSWQKEYAFSQTLLQKNTQAISELEQKESLNKQEEKKLEKLKKRRDSYLIPQQQKQLDRVKENIKTDTQSRENQAELTAEAKNKKIQALEKRLSNPNISSGTKQDLTKELNALQGTGGVKGVTTVPTDIPEDMEGIRTWFADENNVAALQKISPKDAENIQALLEEKQIASKADLIKRYEQGKLDDLEYKQIALIIAHSLDGGTNPNASMNLYQQFINDKQTGNPGVTADDVRNTDIRAASLAETIRKNMLGEATAFSKELKDINDAATTGTGDDEKIDYSNPKFITKLKTTLPDFIGRIRNAGQPGAEPIRTKDLELMDSMVAEAVNAKIAGGSEGFIDAMGDFFLRYGKENPTLGGAFDNFQIVLDDNNNPQKVQFTNTRGNYQLPADESMDWENFTQFVGQGELVNYIEARAKKVGGK